MTFEFDEPKYADFKLLLQPRSIRNEDKLLFIPYYITNSDPNLFYIELSKSLHKTNFDKAQRTMTNEFVARIEDSISSKLTKKVLIQRLKSPEIDLIVSSPGEGAMILIDGRPFPSKIATMIVTNWFIGTLDNVPPDINILNLDELKTIPACTNILEFIDAVCAYD